MKINQKGFTPMVVFIVIAIVGLVGVGFYYYTNNQSFSAKEDKTVTEQTQNSMSVDTNQQKSSPEKTTTDNSPKGLESEAASIQLEPVESSFSDIDKNLKELK